MRSQNALLLFLCPFLSERHSEGSVETSPVLVVRIYFLFTVSLLFY